MELSELSSQQEASLFRSGLEEWQDGPQVLTYGAILICRKGKAMLNVNYKDWELYEGAVITLFPNDVVELKVDGDCKSPETENGDCKSPQTENGDCRSPETENGDCKSPQTANSFQAEILKYNPSLLREASLQLEQTVYSSLREDRCRQDTPVVTNIINGMFGLLKVYFDQSECTCISQLVLCQLKAFFIGFHEYLQRNPQYRPDEVKSYRIRELFNRFMMLLERDYKISRDVTGHTPKTIIDQYVILQLKLHLKRSTQSIKEMAWEFHFADVSFFCRYFKKHTGLTPQQIRS